MAYKYDPQETIDLYKGVSESAKKSQDEQFKELYTSSKAQEPLIASAYSAARSGAVTGARVSALGGAEVLANQGLGGSAYTAPTSGRSETMRTYQDVALQNRLSEISTEERAAVNSLSKAMETAYTTKLSNQAAIDTKLATKTASAKIGAAETNYNREQTILGNVNQAVASGTLVDTETAKNYQEITGNSYLDEMKKVNPEAYAVYDYRNKVQTATESETMSANAKSIVDTYATGNPYTTGNSLYATHSVLDSYVDGNITSTDIKDMAEIYGINNITSGIKELENSLILGMETEDTEATPGYQERNTKAYNKIFGESGTMEKLAKDLGIEIDWEEPVETQVEPTAYTVSKGTVGKAGAKYTINETEYNVNWTKNKNDKKSMEVAELDKITTPVDNNIYQGADKRYYIYTSKGWNQLELD